MKIKILILTLFLSVAAWAQKGTITGTISDKDMAGAPLPFANVVIKGTTNGTTSDENGKYTFKVDPGTYTIEFSFVGYEPQEQQVTVTAGETVTVDKTLGTGSYTLKDVEIQAAGNRERETALLVEQKKAVEIKQSIGAQEMSRKGVSDVEEGLTKISGITKVGSRGLFVRGLEDRYNNLLVNGLAVPSNNPFRKIIPLDLFPTDIVSAVDVYKTFNANIYGDFAGGTFNIGTSKGGKSVTKISVGAGFTTNNNLSDFKIAKDADGSKGFFGLTGKDRMLPGIFGGRPTNPELTGQQSLNAFQSGFDVTDKRSPLNTSIGLLHSEKFNLKGDGKFSYLLSLNFDNSYKVRRGADRTVSNTGANGSIEFFNDFESSEYLYDTNTSALISGNYKVGRWDLTANVFYLRNTTNAIQDQFGVSENNEQNPNYLVRTNQLDQSDYLTGQLLGEIALNEDESQLFKAGVSASKTSYQQPDRKFFEGTKSGEDITVSYGGNNFLRQYLDIEGVGYMSGMAEYSVKFGKKADRKNQFSVGYNGNFSLAQSSYRFVSTTTGPTNTLPINELDAQIATDLLANNFRFRETSNGQYKVKLAENNNAGYATLTLHPGTKWEVFAGVRAEQVARETKFRFNGGFNDPFIKRTFEKLYVLPSLNVKYELNEKTNLRFGAGVTYTKPVQIEALPITYINADGTVLNGNPYLENSDNYNIDLKYEFFPTNKEMLAVGVFGKKINNAIERSFTASAGGFQTTFLNTGDATLYGAELEFILDFGRISKMLSDFSFGFNTSLMHTEVKVNPYSVNFTGLLLPSTETHGDRELQGASKWLVNADLKYQFKFSETWTNTATLVYSVFGKRIYSVGNFPFDHIYELPVSKLDFVWSSKLSDHFDVKFAADNILNPLVRMELGEDSDANYIEDSRVLQDYKRGVGFSAGLTYTF
ncbi:TonB-dependent receptor [Flavobacterium longum]|uniref:TonB-dependent receptor n=1 Tax=Flavobacterium longum TaxID=1299340 RepID=UPI0039ECB235